MEKVMPYKGHTIEVDESWRFHVPSKEGYGRWFDSLAEAKKAIDNTVTAEAKLKTKAVKIDVMVLDNAGNRMTITALHRGTGAALVEDYKQERYGRMIETREYRGTVYPDLPWVKEALVEIDRLAKAESVLAAKVRDFSVHIGSTYGSKIAAEDYETTIGKLEDSLAKAKAEAAAAEKEVA